MVIGSCIYAQLLSRVKLLATPWIATHQAPLSMGFSRQRYCSSLPFLSPGDLPDPGIELASLASPALADRFFISYISIIALNVNGLSSNQNTQIGSMHTKKYPYKYGVQETHF